MISGVVKAPWFPTPTWPPLPHALEGKTSEATAELMEARRINPVLTMKWVIEHAPNLPPLFEGLRKARLPEE